MTTLLVIDGHLGESRSQAVVRRMRGALAEAGVSVAEVARRLGVTQQKLSRRMTGHNDFAIEEVDQICQAADLDYVYIMTGIRPVPEGFPVPSKPTDWDTIDGQPGLFPTLLLAG